MQAHVVGREGVADLVDSILVGLPDERVVAAEVAQVDLLPHVLSTPQRSFGSLMPIPPPILLQLWMIAPEDLVRANRQGPGGI